MRKTFLTAMLCVCATGLVAGQADAALVPNGDFVISKPGTNGAVTGVLVSGYVAGVGENANIINGTVNFSDATSSTTTADVLGWVGVNGNPPDVLNNGVDGSTGLNIFAAWGNDVRVQSTSNLGTIQAGESYTITVQVGGPSSSAGGPIGGPLAFHLLADGLQLTPTSSVDVPLPHDGSWHTLSRTYDAASLVANVGQEISILLGVEDDNNFGDRVVFDNVTIDPIPEPSSLALLGLGGLLIARRRRS